MAIVVIHKNNKCPFCGKKLNTTRVLCPNNKVVSGMECSKCKKYFFIEKSYNKLNRLAKKYNNKLKSSVIKYKEHPKKNNQSKEIFQQKLLNKKSVSKNFGSSISEIPVVKVIPPQINISQKRLEECRYYRNGLCIYKNDNCNPVSVKCREFNKITNFAHKENVKKQVNRREGIVPKKKHCSEYISAVVLLNNRRCVIESHNIQDVTVIIRVCKMNGNIIDVTISAAYCIICDEYIILKNDFKSIKRNGILLCQVIDKTPKHLEEHQTSYYGTESRVHSLGYNVIKQYGYTFEQRKIILANIMENYNISKHEILSMLDTNIARDKGQSNYSEAVYKWQQDRKFVENYKLGDCPEVIISEVVIGRRKST